MKEEIKLQETADRGGIDQKVEINQTKHLTAEEDKALTLLQTLMNATGLEIDDEQLAIDLISETLKKHNNHITSESATDWYKSNHWEEWSSQDGNGEKVQAHWIIYLMESYSQHINKELIEENRKLNSQLIHSERFRAEDARDAQGDYQFIWEQFNDAKKRIQQLEEGIREVVEYGHDLGAIKDQLQSLLNNERQG
jgi:hypothetical protein